MAFIEAEWLVLSWNRRACCTADARMRAPSRSNPTDTAPPSPAVSLPFPTFPHLSPPFFARCPPVCAPVRKVSTLSPSTDTTLCASPPTAVPLALSGSPSALSPAPTSWTRAVSATERVRDDPHTPSRSKNSPPARLPHTTSLPPTGNTTCVRPFRNHGSQLARANRESAHLLHDKMFHLEEATKTQSRKRITWVVPEREHTTGKSREPRQRTGSGCSFIRMYCGEGGGGERSYIKRLKDGSLMTCTVAPVSIKSSPRCAACVPPSR